MFHDASAASISPARRPTRGSGLGAVVDMLPAGVGAPASDEAVERAHADRSSAPRASERRAAGRRGWYAKAMKVYSGEREGSAATFDGAWITGSHSRA